ncbi:MAG: hypothetical protein AAF589_08785, partial [Planctomycetota bacterium]
MAWRQLVAVAVSRTFQYPVALRAYAYTLRLASGGVCLRLLSTRPPGPRRLPLSSRLDPGHRVHRFD